MTAITSFLLEFLVLFGEMAPYLVLGFVLAGLLHAFVPRSAISRHLGNESPGSAVKAAIVGVPMPLCSCGVIPTGIGLLKRGASRAATVSFLISTPQTGVDSIAVTYGFFGWIFAIFRPIAAFLSGIIGGLATLFVQKSERDDQHWLDYHVKSEDMLEQDGTPVSFPERLRRGLRYAFVDLLGDISNWLLLGLVIATAIAFVVPDDFFAGRAGSGIGTKLLMMAFGIPLYVCSTASVPIAAVLMTKGISAGAAFVFLMTGPATNAATMLLIGRVMGMRILVVYLAAIALLALGFGIGLDAFLGATGFTVTPAVDHTHEHMSFGAWITWLMTGLLTFFLVWHSYEKFAGKFVRKPRITNMNSLELQVEGMNCSHCVRSVSDSLKSVPGVESAEVSLQSGVAVVSGDGLDREQLVKAVESAGYSVKSA